MGGTVSLAREGQLASTSDDAIEELCRNVVLGPNLHYDAMVFGNGPAACVFAIEMARHNKTVLLVPPLNESNAKPMGETLAPRGEFLLDKIGLVNRCLAGQHPTQRMLSCWRDVIPEKMDFGFDPHGRMWHISRPAFDQALRNIAVASGVHILNRSVGRVASFMRMSESWEIRLVSPESERIVRTSYIVDATGKASCIARRMGSKRILRDHLVAVSCVVERANGVEPLLIEPVSAGWWYSLGLPQGTLLIALMTDPKLFKLSAGARKSLWHAMLDEAPNTQQRIGVCEHASGVANAETGRLDSMSGEGWFAIGDAAMSFDPISSHGLTAAIEQAISAAERLRYCRPETALIEFEEIRTNLFGRYRAQRSAFYRGVRRFSGQAFWRNRILH